MEKFKDLNGAIRTSLHSKCFLPTSGGSPKFTRRKHHSLNASSLWKPVAAEPSALLNMAYVAHWDFKNTQHVNLCHLEYEATFCISGSQSVPLFSLYILAHGLLRLPPASSIFIVS